MARELLSHAWLMYARLVTTLWLGLATWLVCPPALFAGSEACAICGHHLGPAVFVLEDKATGQKKEVCQECELTLPQCFFCGLPALTNIPGAVSFTDGRRLCARDAASAILNDEEGQKMCREVLRVLQREFSRFLTFPENNVRFQLVDRLHLQASFKFSGYDAKCPNVWGHIATSTNRTGLLHEVSLLSGLPRGAFQAACAHECAHAWMYENLSAHRARTLGHSAEEGFCELIAYDVLDAIGDENSKRNLLVNLYTRGQINLMVQAQQQFGFNDVLDWIRSGIDSEIVGDDLGRIRNLESVPVRPAPTRPLLLQVAALHPAQTNLLLKAVFWTPPKPSALINDCAFGVNEEKFVCLSGSNVLLRCVTITPERVQVQLVKTGEEQHLLLKPR